MTSVQSILSDMGKAALDYARRGIPVLPCGPDKAPLISGGFKSASLDESQIAAWWAAHPGAMIGVPTGAASGLYVVDADLDKTTGEQAGEQTLKALGLPMSGPGAVTMSGGRHLYFRHPGPAFHNTAKKIGPGVDTRGEGGYVIVPPSRGATGEYRAAGPVDWRNLPDLPEVLRTLLTAPKARLLTIDTGVFADDRPADLAELAELLTYIDPDAGGHQAWVHVLMALHDHTGGSGGGLALADEWSTRGAKYQAGEVARKWQGFKAGGGVKLATIAGMARTGGADLAAITRKHRGPILNLVRAPIPSCRKPTLRTARDLQGQRFPPIKWIVPGLLPEGLTILIGAPKLGKSWLTLDIALAVARGGNTLGQDCEQGDVLLLALEDNERRLQDRLNKIGGEGAWPEALSYATDWQRMNAGGLEALEAWIDAAPNPRLIVVDTLGMVKPPATGKGNAYEQDVAALRPLHQLASRRRVSVMVVTHKRKMESDDPLEGISGTNGLTGTADTTIALLRSAGGDGCTLYGRGRDLAELERPVKLVDCRWQVDGEPLEANKGDTWRTILRAVRDGQLTPTHIAEATGIANETVRQNLGRMVRDGALIKLGRGEYNFPMPGNAGPNDVTPPLSQPSQLSQRQGESDTCDTCDNMRGGNTP